LNKGENAGGWKREFRRNGGEESSFEGTNNHLKKKVND